MTRVIELFDRDNILCPEWLLSAIIGTAWVSDSVYSYEDGKHTWTLKRVGRYSVITFDGEKYQFLGYKEGIDAPMYRNEITKDYELIT